MTISSMTGFARANGSNPSSSWQWDLRSVNGKSLDVRFRLPPGLEHIEAAARSIIAASFKRGNVQASLTFEQHQTGNSIVIDEAALEHAIVLSERLRKRLAGSEPNIEALLGLRGIFEIAPQSISEEEAVQRDTNCLQALEEAAVKLKAARQEEGAKIKQILSNALLRIAELIQQAKDNPARKPGTIRARLQEQVDRMLAASTAFDPARLHQEAVLLATKFDIQEEIDRLVAHVSAAQQLLASTEAIGRKFDFLSQEFNREANTICSKSNDIALTNTGLELKTIIDQLREQVQNIE
jgi:uncharacterized protein (TIGR00255 family)